MTIEREKSLCSIIKMALMTVGGSVTIDRVFIWCDYKGRDYREGLTVVENVLKK